MKCCSDRRPGSARPLPRPPASCCAPPGPWYGGDYLMQRILASGQLHRRCQRYSLCVPPVCDAACGPLTVADVSVCAPPAWEDAPCDSRRGLELLVTIPLLLRLRDGRGCLFTVQTILRERLRLTARGSAAECWRGQAQVQAAVRLAGRAQVCPGQENEVPLEVLLEGFVLSPCAVGPDLCRPCPEDRPWYPRLPEEPWPQRRGCCPCE